jgi:hypothetical protein
MEEGWGQQEKRKKTDDHYAHPKSSFGFDGRSIHLGGHV